MHGQTPEVEGGGRGTCTGVQSGQLPQSRGPVGRAKGGLHSLLYLVEQVDYLMKIPGEGKM